MSGNYSLYSMLLAFTCWSLNGGDSENKDPRIKPNGRATKPKVTFVDEKVEKETPTPDEKEHVGEDDEQSSDSGSETEQSEVENEETSTTTTADDNLVLTPDTADLMLSYLDQMNLRMLLCESTTARLLKDHIAGAQARLNTAKKMLDDIPTTMSHTERKVYMLEISRYVEAIFDALKTLSIKLVNCHGDAMCDIIREFDENVQNIEIEAQASPAARKVGGGGWNQALWVLETCVTCAFFVITVYIVCLLTLPEIGSALGGLVLGLANGTYEGRKRASGNWSVGHFF